MKLHIIYNEKVTQRTISVFEDVFPHQNKFIVMNKKGVSSFDTSLYHSEIVFVDGTSKEELRRAVGDASTYQHIILHFLNEFVAEALSIVNHPSIYWIEWGGDLYVNLLRPRGFTLYENETLFFKTTRPHIPVPIAKLLYNHPNIDKSLKNKDGKTARELEEKKKEEEEKKKKNEEFIKKLEEEEKRKEEEKKKKLEQEELIKKLEEQKKLEEIEKLKIKEELDIKRKEQKLKEKLEKERIEKEQEKKRLEEYQKKFEKEEEEKTPDGDCAPPLVNEMIDKENSYKNLQTQIKTLNNQISSQKDLLSIKESQYREIVAKREDLKAAISKFVSNTKYSALNDNKQGCLYKEGDHAQCTESQ